jgi:hypothetical protein
MQRFMKDICLAVEKLILLQGYVLCKNIFFFLPEKFACKKEKFIYLKIIWIFFNRIE